MNHIVKSAALLSALLICSCATQKTIVKTETPSKFPVLNQGGKIAVVAHRGFWNCEAAGFSENTIAALKAAQDNGFWGSEFDIQLTSDDVVIVNHDNSIDGKKIWNTPYAELNKHVQKNGEHVSTLDEYLEQGAKCNTTVLVLEYKTQASNERMDLMIDKTIASLKAHKLFNPKRVVFITFNKYACDKIAKQYPQFVNQYLTGNLSPDELAAAGINGLDYYWTNFLPHKDWLTRARELGMSLNVWTVNKEEDIRKCIDMKVDAITTNYPLLVRELLGANEFVLRKK